MTHNTARSVSQVIFAIVRGLFTTPVRIIPSHHSLLEVLDFSLGVSKCQMYAKLFRIQLLQFESDSLHSESVDCHKRKSLLQQNATLMLKY